MSTKTIQSCHSLYQKASSSLDFYLKNPIQLAQPKSIQNIEQIYQENIIEYQKQEINFFSKVQKTILFTKKQILIMLSDFFPKFQKTTLSQFSPILLILTKSFKQLLKQNIMTFVMQLDQLNKQTEDQITKELIINTKSIVNTLLRHFFTYKQFLRQQFSQLTKSNNGSSKTNVKSQKIMSAHIHKKESNKKIQSPSLKTSNHELQIEKIEKKFEDLTITQLMDSYLQKQCQQLDKIQQVCRICSQNIPIEQLKRHVKFCNKRMQFKQRSIEVIGQIQKIMNQMKPKHFELELNTKQKTQNQEKLLEIFKMVYKNASRGQGSRRSSVFSLNKNIILSDQIKNKINSYLLDQQDKKLQAFLSLHQEKQSIDLNIHNLEKNYQVQKSKSPDNQNSSVDSLKSLKKFCDTKSIVKSKFAQRSSQSSNKNSQFPKEEEDEIKNSQCKIQSISSIQSEKEQKFQPHHLSHKTIDQKRYSKLSKKSGNSRNSKNSKNSKNSRDNRAPAKKSSSFIPGNMSISRASRIRLKRHPTLIKRDSQQNISQEFIQSRKCLSDEVQIKSNFQEQVQAKKLSIKDFQILMFLGKGAFGKVYLARRSKTKDIYAIKVINIKPQWGEQEYKAIKNQHQIFKKIGGAHLVKAPFSFRQGNAHFFIMEFMPGGDLGQLLKNEVYLDEDVSKLYIAQIILAIEHLHKAGIIHRDLKPENLCIDEQGHLKLTDFGLSQIRIQDKLSLVKQLGRTRLHCTQNGQPKRARTFKKRTAIRNNRKSQIKLIGTPDYIAPQIINKTSTNNDTIDWWSLGVMIYQILVGVRPFCGQTIQQVIDNILEFKIQWPQIGNQSGMMSPQAQNLISRLIDRDFMNRLGSKGAQQIMDHPFFKGVNWKNIKDQKPPFPPTTKISALQIEDLQQNEFYRAQIEEAMGVLKNQQDEQQDKKLKITNFVRYDLLGQETIQRAQKNIQYKGSKLKRLASLAKSMNYNQKDNNSKSSRKLTFNLVYQQQIQIQENKQNINKVDSKSNSNKSLGN